MDIKYRQDINHNYMILDKSGNTKAPLAEKMLLHNNIPGFLKLSVQHLNGKAYYLYDIRSRQALNVLFEGKSMSYSELRSLLNGLVKAADRMSDYLLRTTDILVRPQCIFWNLETGEPVFCCYPEAGDTYTEAYMELAQFIIDSADKEDENAVKLAYDYFNQVCDGIYSPENIIKRSISMEEEEKEEEKDYEDPLPPESLWENEEDFSAGSEGTGIFQEEDDSSAGKIKTPVLLCIAAGVAVIAALVLALKTGIVKLPGIPDRSLVSIAGAAALILSVAIVGIIYMKKRPKKEDGEEEAEVYFEKADRDLRRDEIEQAEYLAQDERRSLIENSGETVLLSDYVPQSSLAGRRIKTDIAMLTGNINGREEKYVIDKSPFTIGKMAGKADAVIADRRVSRIHASIRKNGERYFISDLNSTNGTCLNDRRLEQDEAAALEDGDIIKFANVMLRFRCS